MKATIIGSDFLQIDNQVKFLEINTNTGILNGGADLLDYDSLFNLLTVNNITEFHFIWTTGTAYSPNDEPYRFKEILNEKCVTNNITFTDYEVLPNSLTVPLIEDTDNKFILRQAFDATALLDDLYCADKFEFFNLMSGSEHIPNTYFNSEELEMDSLTGFDTFNTEHPNLLIKARNPVYDIQTYPALYLATDISEVDNLKNNLPDNHLLQEFIFSEENVIDGKYSIIRSIDIVFGGELDIINMGGYRHSTLIPLDVDTNEFVDSTTQLSKNSRHKYITKLLHNPTIRVYHTDIDSLILLEDGTLTNTDSIQVGDVVRSVNFVDFNGLNGAFAPETYDPENPPLWDSTFIQSQTTLTSRTTALSKITANDVLDAYFIRITTTDGNSWLDTHTAEYYIEESDTGKAGFRTVNELVVGDKFIVTNAETSELNLLEISNLELEWDSRLTYTFDFEPNDLFLVEFGNDQFGIMHNFNCSCCNFLPRACEYCCEPACGDGCFGASK